MKDSPQERARKLFARAAHPTTPEEEARTAALLLVKLIAATPDIAPNLLAPEARRAPIETPRQNPKTTSKPDSGDALRDMLEMLRRAGFPTDHFREPPPAPWPPLRGCERCGGTHGTHFFGCPLRRAETTGKPKHKCCGSVGPHSVFCVEAMACRDCGMRGGRHAPRCKAPGYVRVDP